jgi:hypothetical protein
MGRLTGEFGVKYGGPGGAKQYIIFLIVKRLLKERYLCYPKKVYADYPEKNATVNDTTKDISSASGPRGFFKPPCPLPRLS